MTDLRLLAFASLANLFLLVGCTEPQVPLSDMAEAKRVAEQVLDAWKSGSVMDEMKALTPPIIVSEDLWRKKVALVAYSFNGEGSMLGPNVRFEILLKYKNESGQNEEKVIAYLVTTTPVITFFREDT
jgi:hypothetical protein